MIPTKGFHADRQSYFSPCRDYYTIKAFDDIELKDTSLTVKFFTTNENGEMVDIIISTINVNILHPYLIDMSCKNDVFRDCSPYMIDSDNIAKIDVGSFGIKSIDSIDFNISYDPTLVEYVAIRKNNIIDIETVVKLGTIFFHCSRIQPSEHLFSLMLKWTNVKFDSTQVVLDVKHIINESFSIDESKLPKIRKLYLRYLTPPNPRKIVLTKPIQAISPWPSYDEINSRKISNSKTIRVASDFILLEGSLDNKSNIDDIHNLLFINGETIRINNDSQFRYECDLQFEGKNNVIIQSSNLYGETETIWLLIIRDTTPPDLILEGSNLVYNQSQKTFYTKKTGNIYTLNIYTQKDAILTIDGKNYPISHEERAKDNNDPKKWFSTITLNTTKRNSIFNITSTDSVGNKSEAVLVVE